jgi:uncharacterized protein
MSLAEDTREDEVAALKAAILRDPALVLDDRGLMAALIEAAGGQARNVVDLRGALVRRLEDRLERLEQAHRSVIAAAYETLSGAGQVHRAALGLLGARDGAAFLRALLVEAPDVLTVETARLALEPGPAPLGVEALPGELFVELPEGGVEAYLALDAAPGRDGVWLRPAPVEAELLFGDAAAGIGSEAIVALDLDGRAGLLAFGAADPRRFCAEHGVDLVRFLGDVVARTLPRHLAAG